MTEQINKGPQVGEEQEISLLELWMGIRKRLFWIILFSVLTGIFAFAASRFLITPKYETHAMVIVGKNNKDKQQEKDLQYNDVLLSQKLVDTYKVIIRSRAIQDKIINDLKLDMDPKELDRLTTVTSVDTTEVIKVSVQDVIPERAMDIANQTVEVFKNEVTKIMQLDNVRILDAARLPQKPVSPKMVQNTVLGVLLGLVIGVAIAVFREMTDTRIHGVKDLRMVTDLPVLARIPKTKEE